MKNILYIFISFILIIQTVSAEISIKIISTKGEALVRFGLEEDWKIAVSGINLKEIDTILTGEGGEIVLQFKGEKKFILGSNSILDIGDLREIQEKELFLFLMSKKVEKIEHRNGKTKLRIGNVSSVYGEDKSKSDTTKLKNVDYSKKEINGAIALFIQQYYTNTLYKLHNLVDKYKSKINIGKINFYIAKAFEALDKNGQAMDSYQRVIDNLEASDSLSKEISYYLNESKIALQKLKE